MKTFYIFIVAVVLAIPGYAAESSEPAPVSVASVPDAAAATYHGHKTLHGGFFGDAGNIYHYEVVIKRPGQMKMYLYDEDAKPMKVSGISARYTIFQEDAKLPPAEGNFAEEKKARFYTAQYPHPDTDVLHVLVEARKDGRWVPLEFYIPMKTKGGKAGKTAS